MLTQREYDGAELAMLRYRLRDVTASERQTKPTDRGRAYRRQLEADIRALERRLASEER